MKLSISSIVIAMLIMSQPPLNAQLNYEFGTWQAFPKILENPEVKGRMVAFSWKDIEPSNNVWEWTDFDTQLTDATSDGKPVTFLVYTKEDAPDWIFQNGVPKVTEKDNNGNNIGYSPYYPDEDYKAFFYRMIVKVRTHVENMNPSVRNLIVGVEGCLGSTGDYIGYKGNVPQQYELSSEEFANLYVEFTTKYYAEYINTNPKISLISNPRNSGDEQLNWLLDSCPGTWIKTGSIGKAYQLNDEKSKSLWLKDLLNSKQSHGEFLRARSEFSNQVVATPWWKSSEPKNIFTVFCSEIHWGVDISNLSTSLDNIHNYNDTAYRFFNKYAGEKDPSQSLYAMSALKDALDASDAVRFPASVYGDVDRNNQNRYLNIANAFTNYGALLQDPKTATLGEMDNLAAKGINDVGWDLFPGNYERYLYQIDPNETSVGYWNIASNDPNTIYGRFGRGFEIANNKTALYFDIDDKFFNDAPLNGAYSITVEVTYLDKGRGRFRLYYDSKRNPNAASPIVRLKNTNSWKKIRLTVKNAYFGNRGLNGSDFSIRNAGNNDVIFSVVELSRSVTQGNKGSINNPSEVNSIALPNNQGTELMIMPNPIQHQFNVHLKNNQSIQSISIFDLSGKLVFQKMVNGSGLTISKSDIGNHAGTYIIKVATATHSYSSKIIVL